MDLVLNDLKAKFRSLFANSSETFTIPKRSFSYGWSGSTDVTLGSDEISPISPKLHGKAFGTGALALAEDKNGKMTFPIGLTSDMLPPKPRATCLKSHLQNTRM
jgi:hypothetical protein